MSRVPFIHLAPKDRARTGIASYADVLHQALSKYAPSLDLTRVDASEFLARLPAFPKGAIVWAELGVNEGEIFRALRVQKRLRPDFKRFITIHDSPRFAHSPFRILETFGASLPLRAARRAFNLAFEPLILRQTLQADDEFVCLTSVGRDALERRLRQSLRRAFKTHFIPHLLYLDEPLPVREKKQSDVARIGFFGFITPNKGLGLLIDAAILLKNSNKKTHIPFIAIRGKATPQYLDYLNAQRAKVAEADLSDRISFGDFLPDEALPQFFSEIDFLALPYDAPPVIAASGVLQWARTYGVPVIASETPAFASLIESGKDGILIPQGDATAWAKTLESIATRNIAGDSFSEGIKARQAEATWKKVAEMTLRALDHRC
ncbi:MAG: glycosyltransferase [Chloroherpetonaceae bacterium]|nr:glycosyltransferase [Chloroherpetonaceae bacterium]MDW8437714.1 glycosyltransferase [Chloroherpetonaceae bacterium]